MNALQTKRVLVTVFDTDEWTQYLRVLHCSGPGSQLATCIGGKVPGTLQNPLGWWCDLGSGVVPPELRTIDTTLSGTLLHRFQSGSSCGEARIVA